MTAKRPRQGTDQERRTAEAAALWAAQLDVMPVGVGLSGGPTVEEQQEQIETADRLGAKMRELLEQNAADEPQA